MLAMTFCNEIDFFELKKDIMSAPAKLSVSIKANFQVEADLMWLGDTCSLVFTRWMGRGSSQTFRLFFKDHVRDASMIGEIDDNLHIATVQRKNIIRQCMEDVLSSLDLICQEYKASILDYATWYRDRRPSGKTQNSYSELVTIMACDSVIHAGILATKNWKLVEYPL